MASFLPVTPLQVEAILDYDPSVSLDPFIAAADSLVQSVLVPIYGTTTATAQAALTNIEIWLSAHFYSIMRPRTNEEQAKGIVDRFDSKVNLGLQVTRYGQMALILDTSGALAQINYENMRQGIPTPTIKWLGHRTRRSPPWGWSPGGNCW